MNHKVLIVEDDLNLANILRDFLAQDGFTVDIAVTGQEAHDKFASFCPSLVILDIMLPDDSGIEICRKIRETSDIPILMLSAKGSDVDKILSLGLGADDYLTKPYSPMVVVAHVKALLRRWGKSESKARIEHRDFSLNKDAMTFVYKGVKIDLVSKEFELLYFLSEHPEKVFSKEEIYDAVWKEEYGEYSTVTVHIRKIRHKLEKVGLKADFIKTIWGVGYKFEMEK